MEKTNNHFTKEYLDANVRKIAQRYSDVTALDFVEKDSLEILKIIKRVSSYAYNQIVSLIDREKVIEKWDRCGGIDPRKKRWVAKRKEEFFKLLSK